MLAGVQNLTKFLVVKDRSSKQMSYYSRYKFGTFIAFQGMRPAEVIE